ncbi:hypothetical protein K3723_05055 [Leisingera caerulea]|uniref:hypothetical protein n=1 Tax=Leisingera caerulea TaxID=506591 RepID=UPI0021A25D5F|nr:hypothetical protein [Leisingera caerulea]UWQ63664.1 hypothetical protein K3723_05055 [Leisingera caerulea]
MSSGKQQPEIAAETIPVERIAAVLALLFVTPGILIAVMSKVWLAAASVFFVTAVVLALVLICSPDRAKRIKAALNAPRYRTLYDRDLSANLPLLRRFFRVAEPCPDTGLWGLLRGTFTYGLLDRALLIAVVYPILLLLLHWGASGSPGRLGEVELIPAADPALKGYAALGLVALGLTYPLAEKWTSASPKPLIRSASDWLVVIYCAVLSAGVWALGLPPAALLLTIAGAFAGAGAVAASAAAKGPLSFVGAATFALAVVVALSVVVGLTGTDATNVGKSLLVIAGIVVAATAFANIVDRLIENHRNTIAILVTLLVPTAALCASVFWLPWREFEDSVDRATSVLMFLGVLPLINAVFDTVSYGVTLALAQRGLRGWPFLWAALDGVIALALFLGLGIALVLVVSWVEAITGIDWIDMHGLLENASDFSQYWWLYAMLFSTALPTLYHLSLAALSLQCLVPTPWRRHLSRAIDAAQGGSTPGGIAAALGLGALFCATGASMFLGLFGVAWVLQKFGLGYLLLQYRNALEQVVAWMGGH